MNGAFCCSKLSVALIDCLCELIELVFSMLISRNYCFFRYTLIVRSRLSIQAPRLVRPFTPESPGCIGIRFSRRFRKITFIGRSRGFCCAVDTILEVSEEIGANRPGLLVVLQERKPFGNLNQCELKDAKNILSTAYLVAKSSDNLLILCVKTHSRKFTCLTTARVLSACVSSGTQTLRHRGSP